IIEGMMVVPQANLLSGWSAASLGFNFFQMSLPFQRRKVDVGNTPDLDVIQRQVPLDVRHAAPLVEIGPVEIARFTIQSDAQLRTAFGLGEFDMNVIAINRLFEQLDRLFRAQTGFNRMISIAKPVDQALFPWAVGGGWGRWRR